MLTERVQNWLDKGEFVEFRGRRLYVQRREGKLPMLLLLHGFPSSSFDWGPLLEAHPDNAVLMFDCLGFGLSDKPADHEYTLGWQADAAEELVRQAGSPETFVVGHDMGTSVTTELMARDLRGELSFKMTGVLLFNGSILFHLATLTRSQKLLRSPFARLASRLSNKRVFVDEFSRLFSSGHPLSSEEADDQWELITNNDGQRITHLTINYTRERERYTDRWHGAFRDWPGPLSLAWGLQDPVANPRLLDGLLELRPGVPVQKLPELGHYPQIEDPVAIGAALQAALAR
jgi:pimeloyl-ACP methyl ester carboxylesterase